MKCHSSSSCLSQGVPCPRRPSSCPVVMCHLGRGHVGPWPLSDLLDLLLTGPTPSIASCWPPQCAKCPKLRCSPAPPPILTAWGSIPWMTQLTHLRCPTPATSLNTDPPEDPPTPLIHLTPLTGFSHPTWPKLDSGLSSPQIFCPTFTTIHLTVLAQISNSFTPLFQYPHI